MRYYCKFPGPVGRLMLYSLRYCSLAILLALLCTPQWVLAEAPIRQGLFHIERNKNANIIQYDAQINPDGKLFKKQPVTAYWIRLAEQGQVKKLSWIQRVFAFGFDAKLNEDRESVELTMKVDLGEPIRIIREKNQYRATAPINGSPSYLEKIYIQAAPKGLFVNVESIELFGTDMKTGEARRQTFFP